MKNFRIRFFDEYDFQLIPNVCNVRRVTVFLVNREFKKSGHKMVNSHIQKIHKRK